MQDKIYLNINDSKKFLLWLPPKTGSNHAVEVFRQFDFDYYECSYDRKTIFQKGKTINLNHGIYLFEGHTDYKIICTARNPLKRIFSAYFYTHKVSERKTELNQKNFIKFFVQTLYDNDSVWLQGIFFDKRKPDYYLRTEFLYDDYMKIPFIAESTLAKSGALKELCKKKINSAEKPEFNIKDFYTQDMINCLYDRYKEYFDLLGYEPKL